MTKSSAFNQEHPFMFNIDWLGDYVRELVADDEKELALEHLVVIKKKYVEAKASKQIPKNSFAYSHFQEYWNEESELIKKGKTFPNGFSDKVLYEIDQLTRYAKGIRTTKELPKSLDDLIYRAEECYKLLLEMEPQIINHDFEFVRGDRKKGIIAAWYSVLKQRGYVRVIISDRDAVTLLNSKFRNLNLGQDGRTLRQTDSYVFNDNRRIFLSRIPPYSE
ncbi:hypothetical protein [Algoriphagus sediminis]|uniref:Uncharacterized protein n=1 Tax=Algoriphagus sediminis TaxID=3057113 RepID=A0ABT7YHE2_9BACT|nr:hypothetical protein [Algoriphagus sediminis]MDN3205930.1 hypothetical protein [Algoriphagus sediminis]